MIKVIRVLFEPQKSRDVLEESILKVKDYPKMKPVFIDLYSSDKFIKEEIDFIEMGFNTYKTKSELEDFSFFSIFEVKRLYVYSFSSIDYF